MHSVTKFSVSPFYLSLGSGWPPGALRTGGVCTARLGGRRKGEGGGGVGAGWLPHPAGRPVSAPLCRLRRWCWCSVREASGSSQTVAVGLSRSCSGGPRRVESSRVGPSRAEPRRIQSELSRAKPRQAEPGPGREVSSTCACVRWTSCGGRRAVDASRRAGRLPEGYQRLLPKLLRVCSECYQRLLTEGRD